MQPEPHGHVDTPGADTSVERRARKDRRSSLFSREGVGVSALVPINGAPRKWRSAAQSKQKRASSESGFKTDDPRRSLRDKAQACLESWLSARVEPEAWTRKAQVCLESQLRTRAELDGHNRMAPACLQSQLKAGAEQEGLNRQALVEQEWNGKEEPETRLGVGSGVDSEGSCTGAGSGADSEMDCQDSWTEVGSGVESERSQTG
ncbi:hypothetical protein Q8A67_023099 [Cirrhinus molitorella]|uniref:Uncharacterized protein n=1 Tax=Cirrhinus molitorella TaxID=172907 RepID=A0AA88P2W3_9TELE|nr:hypothetical protein Q8A67_023099 [Cirrhinus molitorella]